MTDETEAPRPPVEEPPALTPAQKRAATMAKKKAEAARREARRQAKAEERAAAKIAAEAQPSQVQVDAEIASMLAEKQAAAAPALDEPSDDEIHPDPQYRGLLTWGDYRAAKAKALSKVKAAAKAAQMKRVQEAEELRLAQEEGIVAAGVMGEIVTIERLDLPPDMAWIALDGKRYLANQRVTCTRAVAAVLLDLAYHGHVNEAARLGRDPRDFHARQIAPSVTNVGRGSVEMARRPDGRPAVARRID